jgi:hypothetical protein
VQLVDLSQLVWLPYRITTTAVNVGRNDRNDFVALMPGESWSFTREVSDFPQNIAPGDKFRYGLRELQLTGRIGDIIMIIKILWCGLMAGFLIRKIMGGVLNLWCRLVTGPNLHWLNDKLYLLIRKHSDTNTL